MGERMAMPDLEDAIALAALAHRGQVDKAGAPYMLHPLRMMLRVQTDAEPQTPDTSGTMACRAGRARSAL